MDLDKFIEVLLKQFNKKDLIEWDKLTKKEQKIVSMRAWFTVLLNKDIVQSNSIH